MAVPLPVLAGALKLTGVGGTKAAAGVVLAVAVVATGGIVVLAPTSTNPATTADSAGDVRVDEAAVALSDEDRG